LYVGSVQSALVVQADPYVEAAVAPELDPLLPPLLDPELLPLLDPLELPDALPELLPEPLDDALPELLELLDAPPEEPPLDAAPLLLEEVPPPDEELLLLEPDEPLPPELDPGAVPGNVWPTPEEPPPPDVGVPPPVSSELQAQRQSARAAMAAAVGPMDLRRIMHGACCIRGTSSIGCAHAARMQRRCANGAE
jgi:hypothetical protein